jgi:hypothetical protein
MKHPAALLLLATLLPAAAFLAPPPAAACGPFEYVVRFWNDFAPDDVDRFCAGELGIPGPRFDLRLAWVTWRHLEGLPVPPSCGVSPRSDGTRPADQLWIEARTAIRPDGPRWMDTVRYEQRPSPDGRYTDYVSYENCLPDAFRTAAATLDARIAAYGAGDPAVAEWLRGQDAVFDNCGGGGTLPDDPDPSWPSWLLADRDYQIAGAWFYSGNWDEAETRFRAIAADPASPWRETADFVVARVLGRAGRLDDAIVHLDELLADPSRSDWHATARRVRAHLRHRAVPAEVTAEIGLRLRAAEPPADLQQDLIDLGLLFGGPPSTDPLLGYLQTVTVALPPNAESALAQWQAGGPLSWWLAAAIAHQRITEAPGWDGRPAWSPDDGRRIAEDLLARAPEAQGPAALAIAFQRLRLLRHAGRLAEGEADLAGLLARPDLTVSDRNRLLDLQRRLAPDLAGFVRLSQWQSPQHGWYYGGGSSLDAQAEGLEELRLLDEVAAARLDSEPLDDLLGVARGEDLSAPVAKQLLAAALTRAVLAGRIGLAAEVARELAPLAPALAPALLALADEPPASRLFVAALVLLRGPGFDPHVHGGLGRGIDVEILPLATIDSYGANWWCADRSPSAAFAERRCAATPEGCPEPELVDADLTGTGPGDWRRQARDAAPIVLGRVVLDWADAHRDDPRVPEALHRVVRSTRYACGRGVGDFAEVSRGAFERLRRRYPDSPWTEKTPYWFK